MSVRNFELSLRIPDQTQRKRVSEKQSRFIMAIIYFSNVSNYQCKIFYLVSEALCAFGMKYMF